MGGLGNQLFQIGAAEHIARATGRRLYITDLRSPATGHSSEQYFSNILSAYCSKYKPDIGWNLVIHEREPKFTFEDFTEKIPDDPAIIPCLIGYFQRHEYIKDDFVNVIKESLPRTYKYQDIEQRVFLHIRGGDYRHTPLHNVPLDDYYHRAIMHFPEGTEWVVFTNDREYAESKDFIPEDAVYVEEDEISTLALMSRCKGGICANSTFSWWGARLNPDRRIIIPDLWFTDPNFRSDGYYYPGWGIIGVYPVALSAGLP